MRYLNNKLCEKLAIENNKGQTNTKRVTLMYSKNRTEFRNDNTSIYPIVNLSSNKIDNITKGILFTVLSPTESCAKFT